MATKHTRYYELLGVASDASVDDLKKAYRRKALQLHPDKRGNTPEAQDEFTTMKAAYDVLSDPKQREIYDTMGEDGLRVMNEFGEMSFDEVVAAALGAVIALGPCAKAMIIVGVVVALGLVLMVPSTSMYRDASETYFDVVVFWCVRADADVDWTWVNAFIPMWILDALYVCWKGCSMLAGETPSEEDKNERPPPISRALAKGAILLHVALFILTQIFVAMKLQGSVSWSCGAVLAPLFALESLYLLEKLVAAHHVYSAFRARSDAPTNFLVVEIGRSCIFSLLRIAFEILLALRVDETITASWWVVFIPVWLVLAAVLAPLVKALVARSRVTDEERPNACMNVCLIVACGAMLSPFVVLAARLESSFSSVYILLPWFILAGGLLCVISACLCCSAPPPTSYDDEPTVESPQGGPEASPHPYFHNEDNMA
ncbi:hypothetical protein ACHHYP_04230 [Achlya hypogyna]|uniref:J domain-containing protein n=1 Tax=Achlya hypogyna TaxID=1202772 RepID=A0A1V9ZPD3_ACHHY|nr:hypothetical protein ACHHYP_04230 [Achlya hypogyna]